MKRSIYDENGNIIGEQILNENKESQLKLNIQEIIKPHLQKVYDELENLKSLLKDKK